MSGMPINEEDISLRTFFGGSSGGDLIYPLLSSSSSSSYAYSPLSAGDSSGYALAQALCSSKAMQAAVRTRHDTALTWHRYLEYIHACIHACIYHIWICTRACINTRSVLYMRCVCRRRSTGPRAFAIGIQCSRTAFWSWRAPSCGGDTCSRPALLLQLRIIS